MKYLKYKRKSGETAYAEILLNEQETLDRIAYDRDEHAEATVYEDSAELPKAELERELESLKEREAALQKKLSVMEDVLQEMLLEQLGTEETGGDANA